MSYFSNCFVGWKQVASAKELENLLLKLAAKYQPSYYFLRWPHQVSGIISKLQDFPSPEGQMFNSRLELRWKAARLGNNLGYDLLYLGIEQPDSQDPDLLFEAIDGDWGARDRSAHKFTSTETRFPQGFENGDNLNLAQRYFMDARTSTVHFVALTV